MERIVLVMMRGAEAEEQEWLKMALFEVQNSLVVYKLNTY